MFSWQVYFLNDNTIKSLNANLKGHKFSVPAVRVCTPELVFRGFSIPYFLIRFLFFIYNIDFKSISNCFGIANPKEHLFLPSQNFTFAPFKKRDDPKG
jgi:hypothetical protein